MKQTPPPWLWPWLLFLFLIPFEGAISSVGLNFPFILLGLAAAALLMLAPLPRTRISLRSLAVLPLLLALDLSFWFSFDMQVSRAALMPVNILALIYFLVARLSFSEIQIEWMLFSWLRGGGGLALATILSFLMGNTAIDGRASFLGDPNYMAAELLMPLAAAIYAFKKGKKEGLFWIFPILTAAVLSQSRGGLFAMVILVLVVMLYEKRWKRALLFGGLLLVLYLGFAPMLGRFDVTADPTGSGRTEIWQAAFSEGVEYWPTGLGFGTFPNIYHTATQLYRLQNVHDTYLQAFVEAGLFGFMGILLAFAAHLRIRRPIGLPILACLCAIMVAAIFLDTIHYKFLWIAWLMALQTSSEEPLAIL